MNHSVATPSNNSDDMLNFRQVIFIARKWAWLMILLAVVFASAGYGLSRFLPPVYQARTVLMIKELPSTDVNDYTAILMSEREAQMYVEMILNRPLLQKVVTDLNNAVSIEAIAKATQVERIRDTRLIAISVENSDPQLAAAIANGITATFSQQLLLLEGTTFQASKANLENQLNIIDEQMQDIQKNLDALGTEGDTLERSRLSTSLDEYQRTYANLILKYEDIRLAEASTTSGVYTLEPAVVPQNPVRPRVSLNTVLAAVLGLVLAATYVFLVEIMDDTLRTQEDIQRHLQLPILGLIPSYPIEPGNPITRTQPRAPVSDAYRTLKTNLHFAGVDRTLKTILITSSVPGEGKSTLAINLGIVLAQSGQKTILLDSDFRRPKISQYLGLTNRLGLSDLFAEEATALEDKLQPLDSLPLQILAAGKLPPNPTELLASEKMSHFLHDLAEQSSQLIIDTPPLTVVSDAAVLAQRTDGVLLILKPGVTRIGVAKNTIEQLRHAKANLLGVILNDVDIRRDGYYGSYYHAYKNYYTTEKKNSSLPKWLRPNWLRKQKA